MFDCSWELDKLSFKAFAQHQDDARTITKSSQNATYNVHQQLRQKVGNIHNFPSFFCNSSLFCVSAFM